MLEEPQPTHKSTAGVQEWGPAGAAIASSPTIDPKRGVLYVGTGRSTTGIEQSLTDSIAAFGLNDGKLRWVKQLNVRPDRRRAGSPVRRCCEPWQAAMKPFWPGSSRAWCMHSIPITAARFYGKANPAPMRTTTAESPGAPRPTIAPGYVALSGSSTEANKSGGSLWALDPKTGTARWHTQSPAPACSWSEGPCSHAQSQAVTVMPGAVFSGSLDGHLRAYSTIDGKILWDFDTAKAFQTQNGVRASGGPLDHGGATIVNGSVYINLRQYIAGVFSRRKIGLFMARYARITWLNVGAVVHGRGIRQATAHAADPAPPALENSVVKVFSTMRYPDPFKPWTKQAPSEATASGVVIEGKRILTNAHAVLYASQVQIQANAAGDKLSATVLAIAPGIDLAVLQLDDPSFFDTHPPVRARQQAAADQGSGARLRFSDRRHIAVDHQGHRVAHRVRSVQLSGVGPAHPDRCGHQSRQQRRPGHRRRQDDRPRIQPAGRR